VADPCHQLSALGPLHPEPPPLFTGAAQPCAEQTGPCRVGDRGGGDASRHQEPQRVDHHLALASCDVFALVVATRAAPCRGLDAWAGETPCRRVLGTPRLAAPWGTQGVREALPVSTITPWAALPIHPRPLWRLLGQHAPFDAPVDDIKNGMNHRAHIQRAAASTRLGGWNQMFDTIPFGISEVCRVWMSVHPQSVLN